MTPEFIAETLERVRRRCEAARMSGGISLEDKVNGEKIPSDWVFDPVTAYFLPPTLSGIQ